MTGIDRVELAYLKWLLDRSGPVFGLVRTGLGFVLLDRVGASGILHRATGQVPLGQADMLGMLTQRHLPQRLRAEADARRLSMARCLPLRLGGMLRQWLPMGATYVNVGHANLGGRMLRAVKSVPDARAVVMIHDTIPLDHPQLCRNGVPAAFAETLVAVSAHADLVVHPAHVTKAVTDAHFAQAGRVPPGVVAPLGVEMAEPETGVLGRFKPPYFVALGTIEPRKNLDLLVRVWRDLQMGSGPVPHLCVVGNRGWAAPGLFANLDQLVEEGNVTVLHDLGDGAVVSLLQGAEALLFPSLAEGYGLPPIEAAALGVPVISVTLPVVVETLQDYPVYLDTTEVYAWVEAINQQMKHQRQRLDANRPIRVPPNWPDHFDRVFGPV